MGEWIGDAWNAVTNAVGVSWQWISDSNGALTALATIATAVFAVWALVNAGKDSRDRSRPLVIAEFGLAHDSDTSVDLIVRNAGSSMARDILVTFDPALEVPPGFGPNVTATLIRRYKDPLSGAAPGQIFRNVWWSGHMVDGKSDLQNSEPTPDRVTVNVAYRDDRRRPYSDAFVLDVRVLLGETYSVSSASFKGRVKTIDASLKAITTALTKVARVAVAAERRAAVDEDDDRPGRLAQRHLDALNGTQSARSAGDAENEPSDDGDTGDSRTSEGDSDEQREP
jgi:hypothetical protein